MKSTLKNKLRELFNSTRNFEQPLHISEFGVNDEELFNRTIQHALADYLFEYMAKFSDDTSIITALEIFNTSVYFGELIEAANNFINLYDSEEDEREQRRQQLNSFIVICGPLYFSTG